VAKTRSVGAGAIQQAEQFVWCRSPMTAGRLIGIGGKARIKTGVQFGNNDALSSAANAARHGGAVPDLVSTDKNWAAISVVDIFPFAFDRSDPRQITNSLRFLERKAGRDTTVGNQIVMGDVRLAAEG